MSLFLHSSSVLIAPTRQDRDVDTLSVPSIHIERPTTPASISSQSSEPLDAELWARHSMSLDASSPTLDSSSIYSSSSNSYMPSSGTSSSFVSSPSPEDDSPPDYIDTVQLPDVAVKYSFSSTSFNTMIVTPTSDAADLRSKYHISISMNCFTPFSYITTIRRGGTGFGVLVAQFEMGISSESATVTIKDREMEIGSVLKKVAGSRQAGSWLWIPSKKSKALTWDCKSQPFMCHSLTTKKPLAKFTPSRHVEQGEPPSMAELVVSPEGQNHFDDLLVSLLIIERKRLAPGKNKLVKRLFN
ncbi:hypothetical protein NLJ89_g8383 [Agrocybe chaxingu]|uniref:DUF6593 domain-containing protein n=1 Tax=Agrocybe chaxingu TaxID=84603 RepID=A0A9W8JV02_9AGAR|nr:hypothetical protein NLJ89_g8383 [Agrocybe chaxingu]